MTKRQVLLERWDEYQKKILPPDVGEVQRTETRRAFYSGAAAAFYGLAGGVAPGLEEPTPQELAVADDLDAEIKEFFALVARGLA